MDQLIANIAQKIGVEEAVAKQAVGAVLKFLKENQTKVDFQAILEQLQGAQQVMEATPVTREQVQQPTESKKSAGGIFGLVVSLLKIFGIIAMLKAFLQPIFGDSAVKLLESVEDGAELVDVMNKLGINRDQATQVVQMLFSFMQDKLDADLLQKLLDAVPAVKAFVGDLKKTE